MPKRKLAMMICRFTAETTAETTAGAARVAAQVRWHSASLPVDNRACSMADAKAVHQRQHQAASP
jgi:hypothetical protein